jgi:hypothetical protein
MTWAHADGVAQWAERLAAHLLHCPLYGGDATSRCQSLFGVAQALRARTHAIDGEAGGGGHPWLGCVALGCVRALSRPAAGHDPAVAVRHATHAVLLSVLARAHQDDARWLDSAVARALADPGPTVCHRRQAVRAAPDTWGNGMGGGAAAMDAPLRVALGAAVGLTAAAAHGDDEDNDEHVRAPHADLPAEAPALKPQSDAMLWESLPYRIRPPTPAAAAYVFVLPTTTDASDQRRGPCVVCVGVWVGEGSQAASGAERGGADGPRAAAGVLRPRPRDARGAGR